MSASFASLMYAFMGLPLAVIVLINLVGKKAIRKVCVPLGIIVGAVQIITAIVSAMLLLQYNKAAITFSQFWDMKASTEAAFFSVDIFSLVVLLCIGIVTIASFITARAIFNDKVFNFTNLMMVLLLGMNGIALVTDLFSLYVFLEITGVASFVLIAMQRDSLGLEGSFKYLVMSCIATAFILAGLAFLFMEAGSLQYNVVRSLLQSGTENLILNYIAFLLVIAGFSIKAGIAPFHGWLPDAYQGSPAPVSVILGGIVTKMAGVYAIIRIMGDLLSGSYSVINTAFMMLGLISIVLGAVAAVGQHDFKRILAYSSISQIGYIILGISCGNVLGFIGAVFHFFNHATFKTTLFVDAAAVEKQIGTTDIDQLGGLQKQLPVTGVSSIIAFLSTAGIPPFAGFWSKLLIVMAAWQVNGPIVAGIALFASIFTVAYFLHLQRKVFFGPVEEKFADIKESLGGMKVVLILLTAITIVVGLLFPLLLQSLQLHGLL